MNLEEYILNLIHEVQSYELTTDDKKSSKRDLPGYIFSKLNRKKFRRIKMSKESQETLRNKVKEKVKSNEPIHLVIPFGGYKHFWNSSHPEVDFAELFNFIYLTDYLSPILKVYKPGVWIEYMSEDMIVTRMNNYPKESLEEYSTSFRKLLDWYKSKLILSNLNIEYFRVGDRVNKEKVIDDIENLLSVKYEDFKKLSEEDKDTELKRSNRSIYWIGEKDLTGLTEEEKEKRIIESRLVELNYYDVEAKEENMGNYLGDNICVCFSFGLSSDNTFDDLTLGSTYGSIVDFWIGRGLLIKNDKNDLRPSIVSKYQYENIKDSIKLEEFNLIDLGNLKKIEVYKENK